MSASFLRLAAVDVYYLSSQRMNQKKKNHTFVYRKGLIRFPHLVANNDDASSVRLPPTEQRVTIQLSTSTHRPPQ